MIETYKKHLIVASASIEETTGKYISFAMISWRRDERREIHSLETSKERYDHPDRAMYFGMASSKNWIDDKLGIEP